MANQIQVLELVPDEVNRSGSWLLWPGEPDEALRESLRVVGQTAPVLVARQGEGWALVAGQRRLQALVELGRSVLAVEVDGPGPVERGLLFLADNAASGRELAPGQQVRVLRFFAEYLDAAALADKVAPHLGLNPRGKPWKRLLDWMALDIDWDEHLEAGRMPLECAAWLARMTEAERAALEPYFADFGWSKGNAVGFVSSLFEAARLRDRGVDELLAAEGFAALRERGLSPKDAARVLLDRARAVRHPGLAILAGRWNRIADGLATGTPWRLEQPDNFETGAVALALRVKDRAQLLSARDALAAMADSPHWEQLFTLAREPGDGGETA